MWRSYTYTHLKIVILNNINMKKVIFIATIISFLSYSCLSPKKIEKSYQLFQTGLENMANFNYKELRVKEGDNLTIQVFTLASNDQAQAMVFNLPGGAGKPATYNVNNNGEIDLPKLGRYKVVGNTCSELKTKLKLEWSKYIKDIAVDVQMNGFSANILGEVKIPGIKLFKTERATIIDLIAASGGLADDGKRKDILLIREDSGKRTSYTVDLTSAKIYESPVFQLQQNDLVYVGAAETKFTALRAVNFQQNISPIATISSLAFAALNLVAILVVIRR